jgi:hypothetical protein
MLKGHIACQWGSQAARLLHNKCRGSVAQWAYVRPVPQAYVTHNRSLGCTRPSPGRGIGTFCRHVHTQLGSGHMSPPDPCLSKVRVFSTLDTRGPTVSSLDPTEKGTGPNSEVRP